MACRDGDTHRNCRCGILAPRPATPPYWWTLDHFKRDAITISLEVTFVCSAVGSRPRGLRVRARFPCKRFMLAAMRPIACCRGFDNAGQRPFGPSCLRPCRLMSARKGARKDANTARVDFARIRKRAKTFSMPLRFGVMMTFTSTPSASLELHRESSTGDWCGPQSFWLEADRWAGPGPCPAPRATRPASF